MRKVIEYPILYADVPPERLDEFLVDWERFMLLVYREEWQMSNEEKWEYIRNWTSDWPRNGEEWQSLSDEGKREHFLNWHKEWVKSGAQVETD